MTEKNNIVVTTLYNKYRPTTFEDIVGQTIPVQTLKNAILSKKVASAYLFSGPRGTGKTSTARIFAKSLLCLDRKEDSADGCGHCMACEDMTRLGEFVDFIEIDAASNRGIENIRLLISQISLSPKISSKKVVLIDEVHHLTPEASTALLKALEEPPSHVVFLLATTNPMKLLDTIRSRCQWLRFKPLSVREIASRLEKIFNNENIAFAKEVPVVIAKQSNGGMRDAISMCDTLMTFVSSNEITLKDAEECFGTVSQATLARVCDSIISDNLSALLMLPQKVSNGEYDGDIDNLLQALSDVFACAIITSQMNNDIYSEGHSDAVIPYIKRFSDEWSVMRLLHARDVIERNWWKIENSSFDSSHVFCEIATLIIRPEEDWKVANTAFIKGTEDNYDYMKKVDEISNEVAEIKAMNTKTMSGIKGIISLLEKAFKKK